MGPLAAVAGDNRRVAPEHTVAAAMVVDRVVAERAAGAGLGVNWAEAPIADLSAPACVRRC